MTSLEALGRSPKSSDLMVGGDLRPCANALTGVRVQCIGQSDCQYYFEVHWRYLIPQLY